MIVDVKILHKILANEIQQRVKKKSDLMTKWALSQGLQFKLGWASLYSPRWQDLDFPPLTPTPVWAGTSKCSLDERAPANQSGLCLARPIRVHISTVAMQISLPRESGLDDVGQPANDKHWVTYSKPSG